MNFSTRKLAHGKLNEIYRLTDPKEQIKLFDKWAETYDEIQINSGYPGPEMGALFMSDQLPNKDSHILDFACGTGRVAEELSKKGYSNIDGLDASQKSLDVAAKKNILQRLMCVLVSGEPLDIESDTYDGLICVGGFGPGQLPIACVDEWIRVTKLGGIIINILRQQWLDECIGYSNYQDIIEEYERLEKWKLVKRDQFDGGDLKWRMAVFIHKVI